MISKSKAVERLEAMRHQVSDAPESGFNDKEQRKNAQEDFDALTLAIEALKPKDRKDKIRELEKLCTDLGYTYNA